MNDYQDSNGTNSTIEFRVTGIGQRTSLKYNQITPEQYSLALNSLMIGATEKRRINYNEPLTYIVNSPDRQKIRVEFGKGNRGGINISGKNSFAVFGLARHLGLVRGIVGRGTEEIQEVSDDFFDESKE